MKKIVCSILCLAMLLGLSLSVNARQSGSTLLTYNNIASYEIAIPASVDIDSSTGSGVLEIELLDANLAPNTIVSIYVSSPNYDGGWILRDTGDINKQLKYSLGTYEGGDDIKNEGIAAAGSDVGTSKVYLTLAETPKVGNFTDTLTFTSVITENMVIIEP